LHLSKTTLGEDKDDSVLLSELLAMKAYWGTGCTATSILKLGTRWRRLVSFTLRVLYPQRKNLSYPLVKEAKWHPELVWTRWQEQKFPVLAGT
jgi:hypothetical protein